MVIPAMDFVLIVIDVVFLTCVIVIFISEDMIYHSHTWKVDRERLEYQLEKYIHENYNLIFIAMKLDILNIALLQL